MKRWVRKESRRRGGGIFEEENLREVCIKQGLEGDGRDGAMKRRSLEGEIREILGAKRARMRGLWKKESGSWAEREN